MANIATEEEQIKTLKNWWHENYKSILTGVTVAVFSLFGWRYWQQELDIQAQQASSLYEKLVEDVEAKKEGVEQMVEQLATDYKSTPYPIFASLLMSSVAIEKDDFDGAKKELRWALENVDNNELRHIIKLRLARLLLADGDEDAALSLLEDHEDAGNFLSDYLEVRGDILLQQGDIEAARDNYQRALTNYNEKANKSILQLKINDLGGAL